MSSYNIFHKQKSHSYKSLVLIGVLYISAMYGSNLSPAQANPSDMASTPHNNAAVSQHSHNFFHALIKLLSIGFPRKTNSTAVKKPAIPIDTNQVTTYTVPDDKDLSRYSGKTPVILVHGTLGNTDDMSSIRESLTKAGIPAYGITFGTGGFSLPGLIPGIGGVNSINKSEKELANFINKIQKETGATKVDLIGHSQGGLLIKDYIAKDTKNNVRAVVDLGADNHGSTLNGGSDLLNNLPKFIRNAVVHCLSALLGPGTTDQLPDSTFIHNLNKYPDTKAGIHYLVLGSRDDLISTPYQNTFLKPVPGADVTNQEVHSISHVIGWIDHLMLPSYAPIVQYVTQYIEHKGEPAGQNTYGAQTQKSSTKPEMMMTGQGTSAHALSSQGTTAPTISLLG